jgi:hypothetical protein
MFEHKNIKYIEGYSCIQISKLSVDYGIPQGAVLGPTLFLLFINDSPEHVNCNVRVFADDCLLYRNLNNQSDSELLQKDLTNLENWEKTWQMKFNPEKCYVIHVTKKKIPLKFDYLLHSHILQPVKNGKYLGVTISNGLDWGPHINNIIVQKPIKP